MKVGESGVSIVLSPSGLPNNNSLTGATVTLKLQAPSAQAAAAYPMTVAADGTTASYVTTGSEFPEPGAYQVQFVVAYLNQTLKSDIQALPVGRSL